MDLDTAFLKKAAQFGGPDVQEVERCLNFLSREYVEMRYQVRRQGADPSKEPSLVEGSSGCAVGSPPGPLMEADKEVGPVGPLWWKNWGLDEDPFWILVSDIF